MVDSILLQHQEGFQQLSQVVPDLIHIKMREESYKWIETKILRYDVDFLIGKKEIHQLRHVLLPLYQFEEPDFCKDEFR